jgi:hypothetical protein
MVLVGTMSSDFPKLAAFKPIEVEQAESHTEVVCAATKRLEIRHAFTSRIERYARASAGIRS